MIALKEFLANVPYWGFAITIAVTFYGLMSWGSTHINENFRQNLTHWLNGQYESSWSEQFCQLFDRFFGDKPLSLKRFVRSSIASFIAVWFLYVLFTQVLGVLGNRTYGNLSFLQAVLIGAVINIVPDYISLLETRWLLERFAKWHNFFVQLGLLIADFLFSAAIIWIAIALFSLVRDGRAPSWFEMIALFNVYSLFFYSTFLTSLWALVYCLSAWFIRLFLNLRLGKMFEIEKEPLRRVGLVGSGLLIIGAVFLSPLLNPTDGHNSNRFNDFVCRWDPNSCLHAARLSDDPQRVIHFMSTVCESYYTSDCEDQLTKFFSEDWTDINTLLQKACDGGDMTGCAYLGVNFTEGRGGEVDFAKANELYEQACEGDFMRGCTNLGISYVNGEDVKVDFAKANELFDQACVGDEMVGCLDLGFSYAIGRGVEVDFAVANGLYKQVCERDNMHGCGNLGISYRDGRGVEVDFAKANDLFEQACERGLLNSCVNLGLIYVDELGGRVDFAKANELFDQACVGDVMTGCFNLGHSYAIGRGVEVDLNETDALWTRFEQNFENVNALYQYVCDSGLEYACERLSALTK